MPPLLTGIAPALSVACAVRGPYADYAAVLLASLRANAGPVRLHVLHGPELIGRERLGDDVTFHEIADERVAALPTEELFTPAMWYRIFLPELLPEARRVLYLDVDTLVLDTLAPLAELDLDGHAVAAVTNVFMPGAERRLERFGLTPGQYFNSGVLLFNLELMRREGLTQALHDYAVAEAPKLSWPDQDALNVVLGRTRLALAPRWNAMNSVYAFRHAKKALGRRAVREARARPAIRHFEGPGANKPWDPACDAPHAADWRALQALTAMRQV